MRAGPVRLTVVSGPSTLTAALASTPAGNGTTSAGAGAVPANTAMSAAKRRAGSRRDGAIILLIASPSPPAAGNYFLLRGGILDINEFRHRPMPAPDCRQWIDELWPLVCALAMRPLGGILLDRAEAAEIAEEVFTDF